MPPSLDALQKRLQQRGTESPEEFDVRMRNAPIEMAAAPEYDYVVVNEDAKIDKTVKEIAEIDRKSTRLNSSHGYISYAVFCLKKKKNNKERSLHREYNRAN